MVKHQCDHFIVIVSPHKNAAFASDLPDHEGSLRKVPYGFSPNPRGGQCLRAQKNLRGCSFAEPS
jgi:hypothetical protein